MPSDAFNRFKQRVIYANGRLGVNSLLRRLADAYEGSMNRGPEAAVPPAIPGWSIVVITDGKSGACLDRLIASAKAELSGSPYEIVVVGPKSLDLSHVASDIPLTKVLYREIIMWGVPGSISRKKNLGICHARYDKLVVTHDYVALAPGWKKGYDAFGDFDAAVNIVLNLDGKRYTDWVVDEYPGVGQALLPYDRSAPEYQYLNGTYFVAKRDFMLENPLDPNRRWGEREDIEWSSRARAKTKFRLNRESVTTYSKLKPALAEKWFALIK